MDTVIKPVLMLVKKATAINCKITRIAWPCGISGGVVAAGRLGSELRATWSADLGCRFLSSTGAISWDMMTLVIGESEARDFAEEWHYVKEKNTVGC